MINRHTKIIAFLLFTFSLNNLNAQTNKDSTELNEEIKIILVDSLQLDTIQFNGIKIIFPKKTKKEGDQNDKNNEIIKKKNKHFTFPNSRIGSIQFGFTNYYTKTEYLAKNPNGLLELQSNKSFNINIGVFKKYHNVIGNNLRIIYGLGFDIYNYRYANTNVYLSAKSNPLTIALDSSQILTKNKLVSTYLEIPILLNINTNGQNRKKSLNIQLGVTAGYLIGAHTKLKSDNPRRITKERGNYNLNTYKLSAFTGIGYKGLNIYAKMGLNPIFKKYGNSDIRNLSFGINFRP